jgi:hypothetical protein
VAEGIQQAPLSFEFFLNLAPMLPKGAEDVPQDAQELF